VQDFFGPSAVAFEGKELLHRGWTGRDFGGPSARRTSWFITATTCSDLARLGIVELPAREKWWFWGWFTIALPTWEICLIMFKDLGLNLRLESAMLICWV